MKKCATRASVSLGVALCMTVLAAAPAQADLSWATDYYGTLGQTDNPDWVGNLSNNISLASVSFPGTHHSLSVYSGDSVHTQEYYGPHAQTLDRQLQSGIRVFDIRLRPRAINLESYHSIFWQHAHIGDIAAHIKKFLKNHPRETVLLRLKCEANCGDKSEVFERAARKFFSTHAHMLWEPSVRGTGAAPNPLLGEVRGKVVLMVMHRETGSNISGYGIHQLSEWNYSGCEYVQDEYFVPTIFDINSKWKAVQKHLDKTSSAPNDKFYVNFTSGSSAGAYPYTVARAPWLIGIKGVNDALLSYLNENKNIRRTGIMMMDFPGSKLIEKIISYN